MFSMFCNLFHFQTVNSKVSEQPSYFLHPFSEKRGYTGKRLSVFQSVIRPIQFLLRFFRNYKPKYFQFELKYQASREHVILCDAFLGKLLVYFLLNIFIYSLTHWWSFIWAWRLLLSMYQIYCVMHCTSISHPKFYILFIKYLYSVTYIRSYNGHPSNFGRVYLNKTTN